MSRAQPSSYISIFTKIKSQTCLTQLHSLLLKTGLDADPFFAGKLLLSCVDTLSNSLHYARSLFRHFPCPDSFMYNTLIRGQADSGNPFDSFVTFAEMRRKDGLGIDSFSFAFVLKAATNLGCLRVGSQVHCLALVCGFNTHLFVGTSLVSFYGECGFVEYARKAFDEIPEPNVVAWNAVVTAFLRGRDLEGAREVFCLMPFRNLTSWNVMLSGYVKAGELDVAKEAFRAMPMKDGVSWSTMIVGFAQNGVLFEALGFFRELMKEGVQPNEASLTGVLSACALSGAFDSGKMLHGLIEKLGLAWIVSVNNALIDVYSKSGNVGMARLVFERMPEKSSVVSWTSMLAGLAMHGHGEEAIQLFHEMEDCGIRPDGVTFISLLYACSHAGLVEAGRLYFDKMMNVYEIEPNFEHYGCLVDLYGRAGKLHEAYELTCQMPIQPNVIIWRTLLGACSIHGDVKLAEKVKSRLSVLEPGDSGDIVLLSNTYAVSGKWNDVASVRGSMTSQSIRKNPGWSMIVVNKVMYTFVAGAKQGKITEEAYRKLKEIMSTLRVEGGYLPEVTCVFYDVEEEEKEDSVSRHSEKLAVAFGIARLGTGTTIQIVKNLRVCMDCHTVMKLISQVYKLEIVVRDRSRFHSFKNGSCSCNDFW